MKIQNILVITPIYPADDIPKGYTPIVHYFVREWVKFGYNVKVICLPSDFPKMFYRLATPFIHLIESRVGYSISQEPIRHSEYNIENVEVFRIPLKKIVPHSRYSDKIINSTIEQITSYLKRSNFHPDIILGHWVNPSVEVMLMLKKKYSIPCSLVMHDSCGDFDRLYKQEYRNMLADIDIFGYRSPVIQRKFEARFGKQKNSFLCYSGVPASFVSHNNSCKDFEKITKFTFIGNLIQRKYPYETLIALLQSNLDYFEFNIIGSGNEAKKINKKLHELTGSANKIRLHGRVSRTIVLEILEDTDVFVMISRGETFGLVYLEAMASGCITIASKNEGFDGIIKDGWNGFLCDAGNVSELTNIINKIATMTPKQLKEISTNAINTANNMTDEKMAKHYITSVESLIH